MPGISLIIYKNFFQYKNEHLFGFEKNVSVLLFYDRDDLLNASHMSLHLILTCLNRLKKEASSFYYQHAFCCWVQMKKALVFCYV